MIEASLNPCPKWLDIPYNKPFSDNYYFQDQKKLDHDYNVRINTVENLTDLTESVLEYDGGFVVRQVRSIINSALCSSSMVCQHSEPSSGTKNTRGL
jgi:hypothetical protein